MSKPKWIKIEKSKPKPNSTIIYEGNHGGVEATFLYVNNDNIGVAHLPSGSTDLFDKWYYKS